MAVSRKGQMVSSPDGIAWNQLPIALPNYSVLYSIAYGNGQWIAAGWAGHILSSPDGTNWTAQAISAGLLSAISYGGGQWVAVGGFGRVFTSTHVLMWSHATSPVLPANLSRPAH